MDDSKDTDIHEPNGVIFEGEKVGHADKRSRIRRKDGVIFRGEEIGYVDENGKIRKPDGVIFRGEVVGQVKEGKKAHAEDGIILPGQEWGYVDDDGTVRQRDGVLFRGRIVGKMKGKDKAAALGYFVLRFKNIEERFKKLEQKVRSDDNKVRYLGAVRKMLEQVPNANAIGDFDALLRRLRNLEDEIAKVQAQRRYKKEDLCRKAESLSESTDWKQTSQAYVELRDKWKEVGGTGKEYEERLWERFKSAQDKFYKRRKVHFEKLEREHQQNHKKKQSLCSKAESLSSSTDWRGAHEAFKQLQKEWKSIGYAGREHDDSLWQRFRAACDKFYQRRRAHFDNLNKEREENRKKKARLCERAESLSKSTDWKSTHEELKSLMAEWILRGR